MFISWHMLSLWYVDHNEGHVIDKLEVKNLFEEMDLVRRLHGKKYV